MELGQNMAVLVVFGIGAMWVSRCLEPGILANSIQYYGGWLRQDVLSSHAYGAVGQANGLGLVSLLEKERVLGHFNIGTLARPGCA
jgi:hypothetical protein